MLVNLWDEASFYYTFEFIFPRTIEAKGGDEKDTVTKEEGSGSLIRVRNGA